MARNDGKTEKATPRRQREARSHGQIGRSQEVAVAFSLLGALLALQTVTPRAIQIVHDETLALLLSAQSAELPTAQIRTSATAMVLSILGPFLVVAVVTGLAAGITQVGFTFASKAAKPKWSHLSPKKGLERFKPARAGWELARTVLKLGLLTAILWQPMRGWIDDMAEQRSFGRGMEHAAGQVMTIIWRAALLALAVALADFAWQRWKTSRDLRMSRQDVKQEHRQQEGDPIMRAQRRRKAQEFSRNRMLRDVMHADVVVTNPTHYAVALKYDTGDSAPRVVAKGADKLAAKIRTIAYRHGVFVTENKPLARELYRKVKVGRTVPTALFEAVAVVLAMAYRRRGARGAAQLAPRVAPRVVAAHE